MTVKSQPSAVAEEVISKQTMAVFPSSTCAVLVPVPSVRLPAAERICNVILLISKECVYLHSSSVMVITVVSGVPIVAEVPTLGIKTLKSWSPSRTVSSIIDTGTQRVAGSPMLNTTVNGVGVVKSEPSTVQR